MALLEINGNRDIAKQELRVMSCELQHETLNARVEIQKCEFRSTSYEFIFTSYKLKSTSNEFKSKSSRIIYLMKTQVNSLKITTCSKILNLKLFSISLVKSCIQFLVIISCFTFPLFPLFHGFSRKQSE